jgi:hypothetical protein
MCFALFASAFNLLLGYTGLLSFGHAAFLGGSAYIAGQAIKVWGVTPEIGLILGTLTGAVVAKTIGAVLTGAGVGALAGASSVQPVASTASEIASSRARASAPRPWIAAPRRLDCTSHPTPLRPHRFCTCAAVAGRPSGAAAFRLG